MTRAAHSSYRKIGDVPQIIIDAIYQATFNCDLIGPSPDPETGKIRAYEDKKALFTAMHKFVLNTPTRIKRKINRVKTRDYKRSEDLPKELEKYAEALKEKEKSRHAKRRQRGQKSDSEESVVSKRN